MSLRIRPGAPTPEDREPPGRLRPYVLIAGHGRSGTNWLLEIFDRSRRTHCRNEPNECAGSALSALASGWACDPDLGARLEPAWDAAVARTSASFGDRDHAIAVRKDHLSGTAQRIGLVRIAQSKRLHKAMRAVGPPSLRAEEWPVPSWVESPRGKHRVLPVLKVNMVPGWIVWVLRNRPQAHVVHIVRHPGGYLNSLRKRLWSELEFAKVSQDNRDRLGRVAAADPIWSDRFGDLDALSAVEAELWYWRYANETIHRAGEGNPRYHPVAYEELTCNPVGMSRALFRDCGLDWDDDVERAIGRSSEGSQAIASAWREKLGGDEVRLIERILRESPLRGLWDREEPGDWDGDGTGPERNGADPAAGIRDGVLPTRPAKG